MFYNKDTSVIRFYLLSFFQNIVCYYHSEWASQGAQWYSILPPVQEMQEAPA